MKEKYRYIDWNSPMITFSFLIVLVMTAINSYVLITAGHVAAYLRAELWMGREYVYWAYPSLSTWDVVFGVLLIVVPMVAVIARYFLLQERRLGVILMVACMAAQIIWSLEYLLITCSVTEETSPMLTLTVVQMIVCAALSAVPTVYFLRSDDFLF